jgi:BMFP domain-containing protein YqiC
MIVSDFTFSPRERATLRAIAPTACPPQIVEQGLVEETIDGTQAFLRSAPPLIGGALRVGLHLYDMTAALHPAHRGRGASQLDDDQARAWFELWWHSHLLPTREFARRVKSLLAAVYYELDPVRRELEYHPERWIAHVARRRLERYGEEIRQAEARVTRPDPLLKALSQEVR